MIVLDCSAAVDMARRTAEGNALRSFILADERVLSSELFHIELSSAFGKYVKAGILEKSQAISYIRDAVSLVDEFIPLCENYIEAFHESLNLEHSVYDMLYLTLARRNAATLLTLDSKLISLCEQQGVDCIHQGSL